MFPRSAWVGASVSRWPSRFGPPHPRRYCGPARTHRHLGPRLSALNSGQPSSQDLRGGPRCLLGVDPVLAGADPHRTPGPLNANSNTSRHACQCEAPAPASQCSRGLRVESTGPARTARSCEPSRRSQRHRPAPLWSCPGSRVNLQLTASNEGASTMCSRVHLLANPSSPRLSPGWT